MNIIKRLYIKISHLWQRILIEISSETQMKVILKNTPFSDLRVIIWKKLGNQIGVDSYINNSISVIDSSELKTNVVLGNRVALASNIIFITDSAPNYSQLGEWENIKKYIKKAPIYIGDDTWVGAGCVIHPGVTIGKGCIIGACSNVTKDIPDYCMAYGNPIKIVRKIKDDL